MASPGLEEILKHLQSLFEMPGGDSDVVAWARAASDAYAQVGGRTPEMPPSIQLQKVEADGVPCEWVWDKNADPDKRLLYLHGGGWMSGGLNSHRSLSANLSRLAGVAVLAVDYRLAPEHRFPAALDDCVAAYSWMLAHGPDGPAPAGRVFIAGDSAGGNLSVTTMFRVRDSGGRLPDAALPISPAFDLSFSSPSMETRRAVDPLLSYESLCAMAQAYVQDVASLTDPLVSPLFGDLSGLPPMLIHVGDCEVLLDDALLFAEKARAAGVSVEVDVWPEMVHVFQLFAHVLPEGRRSVQKMANFIGSFW